MDKALGYIALARKAGRIELGEEPVGKAAETGKASLIVVAADASEHTWRRARSFASGTAAACVRVDFSKDQLGQAIGRTSLALAAFTDPAMAMAFVKALPQEHADVVSVLEQVIRRSKPTGQGKRKGRSRPATK